MPINITQQRLITPQIVSIQPSSGASQASQAIATVTSNIGLQISDQAQKNYLLRVDTEMRSQIARIERENLGNPEKMEKQLSDYQEGLLETLPYKGLADKVSSNFSIHSQPLINKAYLAKRERIDNETEVESLLGIDSINNAMLDIAPDVFNEDPDIAKVAGEKVQKSILELQDVLNTTKSDGSDMFTPEQKASKVLSARDSMFKKAAGSWLGGQTNKFEAYKKWVDGEVIISFPDENGEMQKFNIRDAIPAETRQKIDKDFITMIKDELSIEASIKSKEEKEFQAKSEIIEADLLVKLQDGKDVLAEVEALRSSLEPDAYTDLRKMAIAAEPINNESKYGELLKRAYDGEDITVDAQYERFVKKSIDNSSYVELIKISKGSAEGIEDPVTTGRRYVVENLGGLSQLMDFTASATIANAKREYDESINQFREKEGRFPSQSEAFEIADELLPRWQLIESSKIGQTLPKPMFMSVSEKAKSQKLTQERIDEIKTKTDKYFLDKLGSAKAMAQDPEYKREMRYIEDFEKIIPKVEEPNKVAK